MKKEKFYRYIGHNGHITSKVLLDDIKHYVYYHLIADKDKLVTDGNKTLPSAMVHEDEVDNWYEIDIPMDNNN